MILTADADAVRAHADRAWRAAIVAAAITVPIATTILVVDYRLMLLAFIVLAAPIVAFAHARQMRSAAASGAIRVSTSGTFVIVEVAGERLQVPASSVVVRAQPDAIVLSLALGENRWRMLALPASEDDLAIASRTLEAIGARVSQESGTPWVVVALLFGVLAMKALAAVAAVLVTVAVANVGLVILGHGGSLARGAWMIGGAFACLLVASLLRVTATKTAR